MESLQLSDESRVLIIYTGGTIGMLVGKHGYVPEPHFLTETLRSQTRFHDPHQDSLFSNASSVQGFRQWSSGSGRSSPLVDRNLVDTDGTATSAPSLSQPTLLVRSSRPVSHLTILSPDQPVDKNQPACVKISEDLYESYLPSLVTPKSSVAGGASKRIRYAVLEWDPLLDSSNIEIEDWIRIATEIELNYHFDAFVILHGTDTMCYTSSALSFLLEDLGKTVIITGAQIPLSQLRNDAVDNLMGALSIAGHYIIPECCLYFNHTLFRGNRVSKTSSYDLSAFSSPNFPPLVNVGIDIVVNWNDVIRPTSLRRFKIHKAMSPFVATLRLFPGIAAATVRAFLMPPIRGVVLETFGAGNAPQRADLMQALKEACERGVIIVAITQCAKGTVSDAYETGRTLLRAGVVPGGDMTPECALAKLSYLLSKPELIPSKIREMIALPLRGELTRPAASAPNDLANGEMNKIKSLLTHFVRLSQPLSSVPQVVVSSDSDESAQDATAAWSKTAAEAASTEIALLPFLMHLAAAKDDVKSLRYCLSFVTSADQPVPGSKEGSAYNGVAGGVVNCLDVASGRAPIHIAALNGSINCINALLESGALVHLRDALGHTALYYAVRQGHAEIVQTLIQAGANLGGMDIEGGFAALGVKTALRNGDQQLLDLWEMVGIRP